MSKIVDMRLIVSANCIFGDWWVSGGSPVVRFDCIEEEAGGGVGGCRGRLLYLLYQS